MKFLILAVIMGLAAADVSHVIDKADREAQILRLEQNIEPSGSYAYGYETSNGIAANEQGTITQVDPETVDKVVQGQASWTSKEGEKIELTYVADGNGYQPQGSHIPTSPPIPDYILRALEYINAHPQAAAEVKLNK